MRAYLGDVGHFFVVLSFVSSLVAALAYFFHQREKTASWLSFARLSFFTHSVSVLAVVIVLFTIIHQRYYEYHYAWEHSSNVLPVHYMISCFWEGQEGSFLLWIFWHVLIGWVLMRQKTEWEAPVMMVFGLVQAFLCSMILGVVVFDNKFGSSPFALLRDVMPDAPVFQKNPNFIPEDGTGLNPLLQNYWMVIHPPTLFLGFALTLVPFAYAFAGLAVNKFKEWVNHALPWMTVAMLVLGIGILMGGYWAYETLNFGGYWNWDPVENAVFVPWLVGVASIHVMIIFKNNGSALKASFLLSAFTFLLILYSTFLTRSGILGNASVHSFTDLGLSGQLLVYLLFFVMVFLMLFFWKSNKMSSKESKDLNVFGKEFWIFLGTTVLCLSSFHVLFVTSIPVYNTIADNLGYRLKMAPPADAMDHYGKIQIWFSIAILLVSSTGQFFYWKKQNKNTLKNTFYYPLVFTAFLLILIIIVSQWLEFRYQPSYLILLLAIAYALVANFFIAKGLTFEKAKLWGGAVTHTGVALMLFGILYSSGYSKVVSLNTSGLLYSKEFSDEMNRENVLLFR
ncbi:MAG: cytochrome c biogenesis protein CcsA, partial [Cytophagales bacterium]